MPTDRVGLVVGVTDGDEETVYHAVALTDALADRDEEVVALRVADAVDDGRLRVVVRVALLDAVSVAEALAELVTVAVCEVVLVPETVTTDAVWDTVTLGGE